MKTLLLILAAWVPTVVHPIKDDATRQALRQAATEKDPVVQEEAAAALALPASQPADRMESAPPPLPPELSEHDAVKLSRMSNAEITAEREFVLQCLTAEETVVREQAVGAADRAGLTEAVPTLLTLFAGADESLRQTLVAALRNLARETAMEATIEEIVRLLDHEPSWLVAYNGCGVLVSIHNDSARDALLELLHHPRPLVRQVGAQALADWNEPGLAPNLHRLLPDSAPAVARAAAETLGKLRNQTSIKPLLGQLAAKPSEGVMEMIAWALGELRAKAAVTALSALVVGTPDDVGAASATALGKIRDKQAVPALRLPLQNVDPPKPRTRRQALWALRQLKDRNSADLAWKILMQRIIPTPMGPVHDSAEVRDEALRYLAATGDKGVAGSLIKILADPTDPMVLQSVMTETFRAIAAVGDAATAPALLAALKTTPPATARPALVEALKKLTGREYRPLPNQDHRHHFIESLAPLPYSIFPPPPGVVPVE